MKDLSISQTRPPGRHAPPCVSPCDPVRCDLGVSASIPLLGAGGSVRAAILNRGYFSISEDIVTLQRSP
jgi:hypothetical protein